MLRRGLFLPYELGTLLDPAMVREGLRRLRAQGRIGAALRPDPGSNAGRVCALESTCYLRNQLLRDADWAGMAHGVEIRVPLADSALLRTLAPVIPAMTAGAGKRRSRKRRARHCRTRSSRVRRRVSAYRPAPGLKYRKPPRARRQKAWRRVAGHAWCSRHAASETRSRSVLSGAGHRRVRRNRRDRAIQPRFFRCARRFPRYSPRWRSCPAIPARPSACPSGRCRPYRAAASSSTRSAPLLRRSSIGPTSYSVVTYISRL